MGETGTEALRQHKQSAKSVLRFLSEQPEAVTKYGLENSTRDFGQELHDRFGVYDRDFVAESWRALKRFPSLIKNPVLRKITQEAVADQWGDDHSLLSAVIDNIDPALSPVIGSAKALEAASSLEEREHLLSELEQRLESFIVNRSYRVHGNRGRSDEPLTLDIMQRSSVDSVYSGDGRFMVDLLSISEALKRARFEINVGRKLGSVNRERLHANTLIGGAKWANLEELKELQGKIEAFDYHLQFNIPDYTDVPIVCYENWKAGSEIIAEATRLHAWAKGRKVILRSSAAYSEDAEDSTGAGIYESVVVEAGADVREFIKAMEAIYHSVDSLEAVEYRQSKGIQEEKMGLVLQEFVDSSPADRGYANTVVKNVPELMDIAYADGLRPIVDKRLAFDQMIHRGRGTIFHYEMDERRRNTGDIKRLAKLALIFERYYGQPIQTEFVQSINQEERTAINIVQARFLPKSFSEKKHIEFPNDEPIFEGRGVGVFDTTLPVLGNNRDNSDRAGVVIFDSSQFFSDPLLSKMYRVEKSIPQSGGAVVLRPPKEGFGHIETLCAERGLALVFSDVDARPQSTHDSFATIEKMRMGIKEGIAVEHVDLGGYTTVRLVSNGLKACVYGVGERNAQVESDDDWNYEPSGAAWRSSGL